MTTVFQICPRVQEPIPVVRLEAPSGPSEVPEALGVPDSVPVVVLVGGATALDAPVPLAPLFVDGLATAVVRAGAAVVDGGTDAGVMRLVGEARAQLGAQFPLVGVAAAGTIRLPGEPTAARPAAAPFEPHHSHLVLVPGDRFGDESPWIADVASAIANGRSSVTVVIGGGAVTWEDIENSVASARPVVVVEGTGGVADAMARALEGPRRVGRIAHLAATGRFRVVRASGGPAALRDAIEAALAEPESVPLAATRGLPEDDEAAISETIASLPLPDIKRRFLEARWLDQIRWMERKATSCQRKYYASRGILIVCSALVPVLNQTGVYTAATLVSLVVAVAAAWEAFFRNGERWRHYRHTVEQLRSEGWLFFERSGPYAEYPDHARAHAAFVLRVEQLLADDVREFIGHIAAEKRAAGDVELERSLRRERPVGGAQMGRNGGLPA